jgi:hypothetical protein
MKNCVFFVKGCQKNVKKEEAAIFHQNLIKEKPQI